MLPCFNILTGSGKIHKSFFCLWIQHVWYVRTNKKKVSPANQFSELSCFSWFSTDVNWSQYSEHSKHREFSELFLQKLFYKDFWAFSLFWYLCQFQFAIASNNPNSEDAFRKKFRHWDLRTVLNPFENVEYFRNIHVHMPHMPFLYQNLESWKPPPNNYWTFNQRIDLHRLQKMFHKDRNSVFFQARSLLKLCFL